MTSDAYECDECGQTWPEDKRQNYQNHIYNRHRLDTESYIERYKRIRGEVPDKYRGAYEEITGQGKAPRAFQATVCYIESDATLDEAGEIFDKTGPTIRGIVWQLIERDVVTLEEVRENNCDNGSQVFGEDRARGKNQHTA